ncbi:MAG: M3 family metallopeptidase, partial [Planctomycetota bacterium]|nr:M3 family metallopeptidase [Planctomycetota bacterium]
MKPISRFALLLPVTGTALSFQFLFAASMEPTPAVTDQTSAAASEIELPADNAFASPSSLPFHTPAFDRIRLEHYQPAFMVGMKQQLAEMDAIAAQKAAPSFENTIVAIEKSGALLTRVRNVFSNMTSAEKTKDLQNIETELAPLQAVHSDNILLNRGLFARVERLFQTRETLELNDEQNEVLKQHYESFVRAGAKLDESQQARIRILNEQLSRLETKFEENLLAITEERSVFIDNVAELDGMSESAITAAAEGAMKRGKADKYLLEITNTTRVPVLTSLNNRATRKRIWEASANRGLGRDGSIDNRPLILEIAQLRAERAKLLGFANHASYKLQNQMAKEPAAARKMLTDLVPGVLAKVQVEATDLKAMIKASGENHELEPWD